METTEAACQSDEPKPGEVVSLESIRCTLCGNLCSFEKLGCAEGQRAYDLARLFADE